MLRSGSGSVGRCSEPRRRLRREAVEQLERRDLRLRYATGLAERRAESRLAELAERGLRLPDVDHAPAVRCLAGDVRDDALRPRLCPAAVAVETEPELLHHR